MLANASSLNSYLLILLIGAAIGFLIFQGALSSLRGIWAPVQQAQNQVYPNGGSNFFYLIILVLGIVLFFSYSRQNGSANPVEPLQPVNYPAGENHGRSLNELVPHVEPQRAFQEEEAIQEPQVEKAAVEYDFDYNVKSVVDDRNEEAGSANILPQHVVQYLAGSDFAAIVEKCEQLKKKYRGINVYVADQGGSLPYKILIGDFASVQDARVFLKVNRINMNDAYVQPLNKYQLVKY